MLRISARPSGLLLIIRIEIVIGGSWFSNLAELNQYPHCCNCSKVTQDKLELQGRPHTLSLCPYGCDFPPISVIQLSYFSFDPTLFESLDGHILQAITAIAGSITIEWLCTNSHCFSFRSCV
ncbi:hypothetical protein JR316_0003681 [Psilocybe cubensis]|uniref:Uncharacterized protein n=1 Tax=Psilocybe cubensis TaxID=181762 RepID=A0ACB8H8K5_PSICU|nr:hypothetical protein JR316_0003681 [Psilocybe cubensis]KAH9484201.1 hypothetical protein JR316_0003681 [Psilocybe cubensis]